MLETYKPNIDELGFRQGLMADPETMSYNDAWGGTIPFPEEDWQDWYEYWFDAPYLTPVPYRGKRNDSGYVRLVAEKIAQIKGLSTEEVERATWENGKRFFRIA